MSWNTSMKGISISNRLGSQKQDSPISMMWRIIICRASFLLLITQIFRSNLSRQSVSNVVGIEYKKGFQWDVLCSGICTGGVVSLWLVLDVPHPNQHAEYRIDA